eukprot:CAMPEP_0119388174 /NCGR_PEP_ID=MMETSP1334-20130426/103840_1 /TAXON_ID=127549 /ORGANISM="Calcidiscus leptoporus, Strain RCC1130" /LENGTH=69 /DNA_ID=CAMNT_0007410075 /DNA_START=72 /DNA_END=282 /DNA_ORIENTATION=+
MAEGTMQKDVDDQMPDADEHTEANPFAAIAIAGLVVGESRCAATHTLRELRSISLRQIRMAAVVVAFAL